MFSFFDLYKRSVGMMRMYRPLRSLKTVPSTYFCRCRGLNNMCRCHVSHLLLKLTIFSTYFRSVAGPAAQRRCEGLYCCLLFMP